MSRSDGRQDRSFDGTPERNREEQPRRFEGGPTSRFGDKAKWLPNGKPSAASQEKPQRTPAEEPLDRPKAAGNAPQPEERPTHWGNVAEWYDELVGDEGSEYHQEVIIPGIVRMLNIAQGGQPLPRVLDLACGQGVLCRRLAEYGCPTTGVDAAEELIDAARKRNEEDELDIRYLVADVTQLLDDDDQLLPVIERESYDVVTIVLSIQNITPLTPVWLACREALKPGGHLIIVMMHPCFRVPRKSDWFWNSANSTQSRLVSTYLSSDQIEIQTHPGLAAHGKDQSSTSHFHRPLQAYVNTLGSSGLLIDHIEEWTSHKTEQPGPKKVAIDRARKEIPMFLAIRARKV